MDKYEISLWEDYSASNSTYFNERKICVIGSDTMTSQSRAHEPNLVEDINGTHTFTFKMYIYYTDGITGEKIKNPFIQYLINERKIKVFWKNEWYDLVIKKCQEDSSGKIITYTCTDLFINELSKSGYSLEFSTELENNIGTIEELATAVLKGSTWQYDSQQSDYIEQYCEGTVYEVVVSRGFTATRQAYDTTATQNINSGQKILIFYDSVASYFDLSGSQSATIQFWYSDSYITDVNDILVTTGNCYKADFILKKNGNYLEGYINNINNRVFQLDFSQGVSQNYRARRMIQSQKSEYDDLLGRYVLLCKKDGKEIYEIATTEYSDPLAVINLIANPKDFTSMEGWIGGDGVITWKIYPEFTSTTTISTYTATSYLKINGWWADTNTGYIYNTGLQSNISYFTPTALEIKDGKIGGITKGEKYVSRFKAKTDNNNNPGSYVKAEDGKKIFCQLFKYDKNTYKVINKNEGVFVVGSMTDNDKWVEVILTANQSISAQEMNDYGLFIYCNGTYWIEDIQFFKYMEGITSYNSTDYKRMNPGEISLQSVARPVYKYYNKNHSNITDPTQLTYLGVFDTEQITTYPPVYNNYEKIATIEAKESNRFNILQSLAETFQAWVRFRIEHNDDGSIKFDNKGIPQKFVYFKKEIGEDTGISFEYGIDLKSISRTIDSDKITTKIIVQNNANEYAQNGFCSIARSKQNFSRENFILNLDYYIQQNILDKQTLNKDLYGTGTNNIGYYYYLRKYNTEYDEITDLLTTKRTELIKQKAEQEVYSQYLLAAQQQKENLESDLMNLAGVTTWTGAQVYAREHTQNEKVQSLLNAWAENKIQIDLYQNSLNQIKNSITTLSNYITNKENRQKTLIEDITTKHIQFNNKYCNYLMEGTWQDESYVDDDKYYLDAINVAYTSSRPQLSYTISVLRLSSLDDYSSKIFKLGDICYMQDKEFFGYNSDNITPYKERILVSKISSFFDTPEKDIITVQNYKSRFDDLFQRITATTQSLQYAEGTFARAAGAINPDKTLSFAILQDTFDYNADLVLNSSNQNVVWDDTGITVTNKFNSADKTKIIAGGIFVSNDGGVTWKNAVRGDGISTDLLTAGRINTSEIYVYDGNAPSFRWDSQGITAYSYTNSSINFGKFVRHDKYGLYGYSGTKDFNPTDEDSIWNNCKFGLTWKGFFLKGANGGSAVEISDKGNGVTFQMKNSIGNNSLEISTTNDIILKTGNINRVIIGRLNPSSSNTAYGIQIKDNTGNNIFKVSSDNENSIGGWNLTKDSFYHASGNNKIGLYSSGTNATVNGENGTYYILAGNNFGVTIDGKIYASAGKIGGWAIQSDRLRSNVANNSYIDILANGSIKGIVNNTEKWSIDRNGMATFNNANITGGKIDLGKAKIENGIGHFEDIVITGNNSSFRMGNVQITNDQLYTTVLHASGGGSVGGWSIGSNTLSGGGNTVLCSDGYLIIGGYQLRAGSIEGAPGLWCSGNISAPSFTTSGYFITAGGYVSAQSLTLTGGTTCSVNGSDLSKLYEWGYLDSYKYLNPSLLARTGRYRVYDAEGATIGWVDL